MSDLPSVLVAATSTPLRDRHADGFLMSGHDVFLASSKIQAVAVIARTAPALLVLGALEHPVNANRLLIELRNGDVGDRPDLATVALARGAHEMDRIQRLEAGADAVVTRDASFLEVRANADAVLARLIRPKRRGYTVDGLQIDPIARTVTAPDGLVELRAREFELLLTMADDPDRVFTKTELLRDIWGYKSPGETRTLDSHACRLRKKIAGAGGPALMHNIWGVGYRLRPPAADAAAVS